MLCDARGYIDLKKVCEWFWEIIKKADTNPKRLKTLLLELNLREIDIFFEEFRKEAHSIIDDCYIPNYVPRYPDDLKIYDKTVQDTFGEKCFDLRGLAYPEVLISEWSWEIIAKANHDSEKLRSILVELTLEEIFLFEKECEDAALNLREDAFVPHMGKYASEDTATDISWWVVSQGKDYYYNIWQNPQLISQTKEEAYKVHWLGTFYGVAGEVYEDKGGVL